MASAETASKSPAKLPTPAERPAADIVIYDGHCRFCTDGVRRLARWDTRGRLAYLSLHDPEVGQRWPELTHDQLMAEMFVVDGQGRKHAGAAAFRYLTTRLPRLYVLAPLLHIPFMLPVYQWCYQQIARRRYRWGKIEDCNDGTCAVHFGGKPK
ncbi:MAG: thiol-disulfide oxidoreductase DCC family protein [Pirellulales bacterium]